MSPTADDMPDNAAARAMQDAAAALEGGTTNVDVGAGGAEPPATGDPGAGGGAQDVTDDDQRKANAAHAEAIQKKLDEQEAALRQAATEAEPEKAAPAAGASTTGTLADGAAAEQRGTVGSAATDAGGAGDQGTVNEPAAFEDSLDDGSPIGEHIMQRLRYFENLVEHQFDHIKALAGRLSSLGHAAPTLPHFPALKSPLGNFNPNDRA